MIRTTAIHLCIRYFGKWEEGEDRFSTSSAYSICYFNFKGSSVRAYTLGGNESGICRVTLDGETVATVDCRTVGDGEICVIESDSVTGDAVHNLVLTLMPRGIGEQVGTLTVLGFGSYEPIHYPMMLREEMRAELADIECGRRSVTPPEEWCPPTRAVKMPLHSVKLTGGIIRSLFDLNIENLRFNAGLE